MTEKQVDADLWHRTRLFHGRLLVLRVAAGARDLAWHHRDVTRTMAAVETLDEVMEIHRLMFPEVESGEVTE